MSALPKDNTMMWLALAIGGGVIAYTVLRKDVIAVKDTAVDAVKYVGDKANPLSQSNIVNTAITEVGKAVTMKDSWSLGTQIYDWLHPEPTPTLTTKATSTNTNYTYLDAKQVNGKWYKLVGKTWQPIVNINAVVMQNGRYKVRIAPSTTK